jgi:NADPH:quinone reductase-like Zn-dependent oxidoreductase
MKAIRVHEHGDPSVLRFEDTPAPTITGNEVLIEVHAAGVNPVDWKTRAGGGIARNRKMPFPFIIGWDAAGVVKQVGKAVTGFEAGEAVLGLVRFPDLGSTYAEFTSAPAAHVVHKPASLNYVEAAALPLVGLTAWQALFEAADLKAGQRILIHAAAGGVGHIAVQLAKWKGAYVIGTASGRNEAFLHEIGVDQFVDYTSVCFEDVVENVDVVLDPVAGETRDRSWQVLEPGGILVSVQGQPDTAKGARIKVRSDFILVQPNAQHLSQLCNLVNQGLLKPQIDRVFSLKDAEKAHLYVQQGHTRGKVVLEVKSINTSF